MPQVSRSLTALSIIRRCGVYRHKLSRTMKVRELIGYPRVPSRTAANRREPTVDFADVSVSNGVPNCQFLADDITTCQARGKIITLSLGRGQGHRIYAIHFRCRRDGFCKQSLVLTCSVLPVLTSEPQAETLWDIFFGGNSSTRPFGIAVLDG
jgi:chitinase